jgi:hypothetical protein
MDDRARAENDRKRHFICDSPNFQREAVVDLINQYDDEARPQGNLSMAFALVPAIPVHDGPESPRHEVFRVGLYAVAANDQGRHFFSCRI